MDFFKELFGTDELFSFFEKIAGTLPMAYDFLFLVLGTYLLQRIVRGKATLLLIIVMSLFVIILHYTTGVSLSEIVLKAYSAKGISFFRQEIFMGAFVLFVSFLGKEDRGITFSMLFPLFIMIESVNILQAVGKETVSDQWPFWGILIFLIIFFAGAIQADRDHEIEEKILNGNASDSDHAYWVKRKREKEREEEQLLQQQYYNNDNHF